MAVPGDEVLSKDIFTKKSFFSFFGPELASESDVAASVHHFHKKKQPSG